jgi:hypothetical protein
MSLLCHQVDTGSSDLAVYSAQDPAAPPGIPVYNPWQSSTASPVACTDTSVSCPCASGASTGNCVYADTYGDGEAHG